MKAEFLFILHPSSLIPSTCHPLTSAADGEFMASTTLPSDPAPSAVAFGDPHLHAQGEIQALAFATDGSLWSVEEAGVVRQWDLRTGRPLTSHLLSDLETVWGFSAGARLLGSASDDL